MGDGFVGPFDLCLWRAAVAAASLAKSFDGDLHFAFALTGNAVDEEAMAGVGDFDDEATASSAADDFDGFDNEATAGSTTCELDGEATAALALHEMGAVGF